MPPTPPAELLIRQRLAALGRGLAGARKGEVTGVHQARVATRRLREALPLLAPGRKGRKLERTIRKLTRVLGPVRELDVALEMLDEFDRPADAPHGGVACLRDVIREERESLQADASREMARYDASKLRKKALAAMAREESGPPPDPRESRLEDRRAAAQRASHRAGRLRAAMENAAGIYLPDRLHEVRIEVKKLRYALEVSQQVSGARAASADATAKTTGTTLRSVSGQIAALKEAQELLGRMHDLEILISRARAVQGTARAADLRISAELDQLVRLWETECRQLHGHYMTQRNRLSTIVERTAAAAARVSKRTSAA